MAEYDAGTLFATVAPSFAGTRRMIEAEAKQWANIIERTLTPALPAAFRNGSASADQYGRRAGSDFGGSFARTVKDRVEAAFRALPKAKPGVDATELDAELEDIRARLAALRDVRVGVDLDAGAALAEIDRLHERLTVLGDRSPNIQVRVDAAKALAELEAVQAEVNHLDHDTASVDVDTHAAESGLSGLLVTALALGPALIPIGAAATAGLAGIVTVAASAAAGIGVIALAFNGVIGALQALGQEHAKSGTTARTSAAAQVSAANQVQSAEAALANTRANADSAAVRSAEQVASARRQAAIDLAAAAQRVVAAEQQAAAADRNSADAQQQLNLAREQAARDLEDVANRSADASLNLRQAQLDLTDAQTQYAAVMRSTSSTEDQRTRAQLALDEATQRVTEAQQEAARAAQDNNAAQQAGVNGSPAVVAASRNVTDAQRAQRQAHQAVAQARRDEARQQQQSAREIADAIRSQQDQARQSAYAVASAQRAVAAALQAQTAAAVPASAANDRAATALAALSPAGRQFVRFVQRELLPMFHAIRNVAQTNLLPGLETGIKAAMPLIGPFTSFVGGLASTLGNLFAQGGRALNSPFWRRFFGYVDATASPTLVIFAHIIGNLAHGFAGLMIAFAPVVTQIGQGLEHLTGRFAAFGEHASTNGTFGRFIDYVQRTGPLVVSTLGSLFRAFGHVAEAIAPLGGVALTVLRAIGNAISAIPTSALGSLAAGILTVVVAMKAWEAIQFVINGALEVWAAVQAILDGELAANPIGIVVLALAGLAAALVYAWKHSETFRDVVHGALHFIATSASSFWHDFLQPILHALGVALHAVGDAATWLWRNAIQPAWHGIGTAVQFYWDNYLHPVLSAAQSIFHAVGDAATWLWHHAIEPAWHGISSISSKLWTDITGFFVGGINGVIRLLNSFLRHVTDVLGFFGIHKHWSIDLIGRQSIVGTVYNAGSQHPGFADGGVLPGYAPGVDSIVAMVSPGEAILRPEVTRWLGADTIHGWNAAARRGSLPGFADGGIVGDSSSSGFFHHFGSAVVHLIRQAADAFIHTLGGVGHRLFSGALHGLRSLFHLGDTSAHGTDAASAQAVARGLLPRFGWDGAQLPALVSLWNHESGWNYLATNPSSGAYGIPQALPATKMASAGADWRTNPVTQIMWGLGYIKDRYGSPAGAWQHELAFNWYDQGGYLPPGASLVLNGTGRPEPVFTHDQLAGLAAGSSSDAKLDQVIALLAAAPELTGEHVGAEIGDRFERAAITHANRTVTLNRKGVR